MIYDDKELSTVALLMSQKEGDQRVESSGDENH